MIRSRNSDNIYKKSVPITVTVNYKKKSAMIHSASSQCQLDFGLILKLWDVRTYEKPV